MIEIFSYDFMLRAFLIGYACAIVAALLGNFLVASRQAVMSDMLAHTSLAGVGLGVLFHVSPPAVAIGTALIASLLLYFLSKQKSLPKEAVSVLILSGGIAIALVCIHLAKNNPVSLETYLFGSILTVTPNELFMFLIMSIVLISCLFIFYNRLLCLIFDKDFFRSKFSSQPFFEIFFMMMVGVFVAFSLKIIGGLLISSLLIIPVLTAQQAVGNFRSSLLWSSVFNIIGITIGIVISFYFDVPTSSAVVLSLIFLFVLLFVFFNSNFKKIVWKKL